jgi:alkyl sulfatase BDS1-like metallo-beta-lactamase superfamily hydrolase
MNMRTFWMLALLVGTACRERSEPRGAGTQRVVATPAQLAQHCKAAVGEPRVEQLSDRIFVAIGYDLANTIAVRTDHGRLIVDAMMSPERAELAKRALDEKVPGPTQAVVLTHSHIDHVGGVSTWLDPGTQIWATDAFADHFLKQYGVFQAAERARGLRQFGAHLDRDALPCSALGRNPDFSARVGAGFRMPTHTFKGSRKLTIDGLAIELVEAHGETDDQLFVWLPEDRALFPGDNYYQAFPNLYTIRGTRPRPIEPWIQSLDAMRRKEPRLLVPSHTVPVRGRAEILEHLTGYRDAIAYLRARVIRAANEGTSLAELADSAALPEHLATRPYLAPLYGELHWSVRAMYTNELGWFDGDTSQLYPLSPSELAAREVRLWGGAERVLEWVEQALTAKDPRWALHLLQKLSNLAERSPGVRDKLSALRGRAERQLGALTANSNGRAYLLESALLREEPDLPAFRPDLTDELLASVPVGMFFEALPGRLDAARAADVHETLLVEIEDVRTRFYLTVRRGVLEVAEGTPLPLTPAPFATLRTSSATFKALALGRSSALFALASGDLSVEGEGLRVREFFARFEREL